MKAQATIVWAFLFYSSRIPKMKEYNPGNTCCGSGDTQCCSVSDPQVISPLTQPETMWDIHETLFENDVLHPVPIKVNKIDPNAKAIHKSRPSDLGWDVYCIEDEAWVNKITVEKGQTKIGERYLVLYPGESHTFRTGIRVATPQGFGFLLRDRSSMGCKDITVEAGVIEGTYRDEWMIHLINVGIKAHEFKSGDKIVQAVLTQIIPGQVEETDYLPPSDRGNKGWGSSGR